MDGEGSVQIAGSVEKIEIETLERENSRKEERVYPYQGLY